jgi:DNA mismatch endonuclease, patch repair protein
MDVLTDRQRSYNMSQIKSEDTKPELKVRKALYAKGYRYRIYYDKLPGKPDIVFIGKKIVIFIHGCFWHQHGCKKSRRPKANKKFWNEKLDRNIERDKEIKAKLEKEGWKVFVVWGCEIKQDIESAILDIEKVLDNH